MNGTSMRKIYVVFFTNAAMIEDTHSIYDLIKSESDNQK